MATKDPSCPICAADLLLTGDERRGDEVFCTYCGAPCILTESRDDPSEFLAEEDF